MSKSTIKWSADGETIETIQPHTKKKHELTEKYVTDLIYTLYSKGRYGINTFTFIDGFCGGGVYHDPESNDKWYGSPIRLINAVKEGYLKSKRQYPLDVKFIFIDSKKDHLNCLKNLAFPEAGFEQLLDEEKHIIETFEGGNLTVQCEFICDQFENQVNYCVFQAEQRKGHSLFFLDPYGYLHVSMESFRKINSLNKSEIIYTLMSRDIERFVFDKNGKEREHFYQMFEAEDYFKNLENANGFGRESEFRDKSMMLFKKKGNAKKVFTFAMIPTEDKRVLYYLIHISSHLRALEVMKESSWSFNNINCQYHYEIYGQGFRTASYYENYQLDLELDINQDNQTACIFKLSKDIDNLINPNGITFEDLCSKTMEFNPATKQHYFEYLKLLRERKRIEILRKDSKTNLYKYTERNKIENSDIIKKTGIEQLSLF